MKKIGKCLISAVLAMTCLIQPLPVYALNNGETVDQTYKKESETENISELSDEQLSSIAMLNYMTALTQEINSSKNSRLYLDNAFSSLTNNIDPTKVDDDSLEEIDQILNTIESYSTISKKRDRVKLIYEQNQASALRHSLGNPVGLLSVVQSRSVLDLVASVIYMSVDSYDSYKNYSTEVEQKYMQDSWKLDDKESANLAESRTDAFDYMVRMSRKYNISKKFSLTEKSVENFVKWENNSNLTRRIQFLEDNKDTYQAYGKYWTVLAKSYYDNGNYQKCINAAQQYEDLKIDTFRYNHELADVLPMVVVSAEKTMSTDDYVEEANHCISLILNNIEDDDWALRYFVAQTYVDLYAKTNDESYLEKAYKELKENTNYLVDDQRSQNNEYLAKYDDIKVPEKKDGYSDNQKKEAKQYNKWLKEERKTKLPPIYEPLVANVDLLFEVADKLDISKSEKDEINEIMHPDDKPLFLVKELEDKYTFDETDNKFGKLNGITFDGDKLIIPTALLENGSTVKVNITDGSSKKTYSDWQVKKVKRGTEGVITSFTTELTSKDVKKQKYTDKTKVTVSIVPPKDSYCDTTSYKMKQTSYRKVAVVTFVKYEQS